MSNVTLPLRVETNRQMANLAPIMFLSLLPCGAFVYFMASSEPSIAPYAVLMALFFLVMDFGAMFIFFKMRAPYFYEIGRTSVTVTPIPIMGINYGRIENRSIGEFESVRHEFYQTPNAVISHQIVLKAKPGHKDIYFELPKDAEPQEYTAQLRAALNLRE